MDKKICINLSNPFNPCSLFQNLHKCSNGFKMTENLPLETHPFGAFLPPDVRYLVVGTFPGRLFSQRSAAENEADLTAFSYGGRNQFWRIMEHLYAVKLPDRATKKALFTQKNIGLMDVIAACRRKKNSNLDTDLTDIVWNKPAFNLLFATQSIETVFCTGKGVATIFTKWFPDVPCVVLPSPSPLFAAKRFEDKCAFYADVFPKN
jgi:hypoxanthine-DNA glycosylase